MNTDQPQPGNCIHDIPFGMDCCKCAEIHAEVICETCGKLKTEPNDIFSGFQHPASQPEPAKREWSFIGPRELGYRDWQVTFYIGNKYAFRASFNYKQEAEEISNRIVEDHNNPLSGLIRTGELHAELEKNDTERDQLKRELEQTRAKIEGLEKYAKHTLPCAAVINGHCICGLSALLEGKTVPE